ncbi:hypothetical protein BOTBODRAFT_32812 [Botryobasidium botryosum FD-172 SS1]|uniref:Alginate lyase domain-containing protein n=1 Tax=Botryobasidium botryosum (strain FD-172 SS1) TaxID=930990 RepID=A0A067MI36_BOTB1|nr:hypothetical protein BOTBODRAFT_32812 [Botryobasidium botryosum FD-172 SS1]
MLFSTITSLLAFAVLSPATLAAPTNTTLAARTFVHPGVLVSLPQLNFVREKVHAREQPWAKAYDDMMASKYASLSREPNPRATVECGPTSNPNIGCTDERQDAIAAYTLALAYFITQDEKYAVKAISIFDAWSTTIKSHTNSNGPLQTGWSACSWAPAAEIIRHTYTGWSSSSIENFSKMLRDVYLPVVIKGSKNNGNWELAMMEATQGIAVFLDDAASYDIAMAKFDARLPAYIYLTTDGKLPAPPPGGDSSPEGIIKYWQGQDTFDMDGIAQETCRDLTHTGYAIASISAVLETSMIQGKDLYGTKAGDRLGAALELHSALQLGTKPVPPSLCHGKIKQELGPITEVGLNALSFRRGAVMPNTQKLTEEQRPAGTDALFVSWGTLTHARNPK